jgi:hypothetical protein
MKEVIKAFLIVSFLGIMIPSGKLTIPNGGILLVTLLESINSIFIEELKLEIFICLVMSLIASAGLLFIFFKRKLYNMIGIVLQLAWLGYLFRKEALNDVYCIATSSIYLLMCFALIFKLFFYKESVTK